MQKDYVDKAKKLIQELYTPDASRDLIPTVATLSVLMEIRDQLDKIHQELKDFREFRERTQ